MVRPVYLSSPEEAMRYQRNVYRKAMLTSDMPRRLRILVDGFKASFLGVSEDIRQHNLDQLLLGLGLTPDVVRESLPHYMVEDPVFEEYDWHDVEDRRRVSEKRKPVDSSGYEYIDGEPVCDSVVTITARHLVLSTLVAELMDIPVKQILAHNHAVSTGRMLEDIHPMIANKQPVRLMPVVDHREWEIF